MYAQSASFLYRCLRERPCSVMPPTPHSVCARAKILWVVCFAEVPVRSLIVSGISPSASDMPRTMRPSLLAWSSSAEPAPLLYTRSMGHPQLTSTKSRPLPTSRASTSAAGTRYSGFDPHTCVPKIRSPSQRRVRLHSDAWPEVNDSAKPISPQWMSDPSDAHTRRNGKLPVVVSGARYSSPRQCSRRFSAGRTLARSAAASLARTLRTAFSCSSSASSVAAAPRGACACSAASAASCA